MGEARAEGAKRREGLQVAPLQLQVARVAGGDPPLGTVLREERGERLVGLGGRGEPALARQRPDMSPLDRVDLRVVRLREQELAPAQEPADQLAGTRRERLEAQEGAAGRARRRRVAEGLPEELRDELGVLGARVQLGQGQPGRLLTGAEGVGGLHAGEQLAQCIPGQGARPGEGRQRRRRLAEPGRLGERAQPGAQLLRPRRGPAAEEVQESLLVSGDRVHGSFPGGAEVRLDQLRRVERSGAGAAGARDERIQARGAALGTVHPAVGAREGVAQRRERRERSGRLRQLAGDLVLERGALGVEGGLPGPSRQVSDAADEQALQRDAVWGRAQGVLPEPEVGVGRAAEQAALDEEQRALGRAPRRLLHLPPVSSREGLQRVGGLQVPRGCPHRQAGAEGVGDQDLLSPEPRAGGGLGRCQGGQGSGVHLVAGAAVLGAGQRERGEGAGGATEQTVPLARRPAPLHPAEFVQRLRVGLRELGERHQTCAALRGQRTQGREGLVESGLRAEQDPSHPGRQREPTLPGYDLAWLAGQLAEERRRPHQPCVGRPLAVPGDLRQRLAQRAGRRGSASRWAAAPVASRAKTAASSRRGWVRRRRSRRTSQTIQASAPQPRAAGTASKVPIRATRARSRTQKL